MKKHACSMLEYINQSPTPYHVVNNLVNMLNQSGAVKLDAGERWNIEKGKCYYLVIKETAIAAFCIGSGDPESGLNIAAAHTDSPGLRIKPVPSFLTDGYERLNVEAYGGGVLHTWVDRPLAIAGVIYIRDGISIKKAFINIEEPVAIIPGIAIHMNRDINEGVKFNIQNELCPLFVQTEKDNDKGFLKYIALKAGCTEQDILSYELMPYDAYPGVFTGGNGEFISSARIDNLAMVHSIFSGFINAAGKRNKNIIAVAFDHEECGSLSDRGAKSNILMMIIDRICESFNKTPSQKYITLAHSFLISGDMAHASHPAYPDKNEPHMRVYLNKGPVLKYNANQSYASSAKGASYIKTLCRNNRLPFQEYANRSDIKGGGTLGPMLSAEYGITAVDIGNPMLSMHSARELCGSYDPYYMTKLIEAYFS